MYVCMYVWLCMPFSTYWLFCLAVCLLVDFCFTLLHSFVAISSILAVAVFNVYHIVLLLFNNHPITINATSTFSWWPCWLYVFYPVLCAMCILCVVQHGSSDSVPSHTCYAQPSHGGPALRTRVTTGRYVRDGTAQPSLSFSLSSYILSSSSLYFFVLPFPLSSQFLPPPFPPTSFFLTFSLSFILCVCVQVCRPPSRWGGSSAWQAPL